MVPAAPGHGRPGWLSSSAHGRQGEHRTRAGPAQGPLGRGPDHRQGRPGAARLGRYTPPEESGATPPPIPKDVRRSPAGTAPLVLVLLVLGVLMILLNYLTVLPGAVSVWYLVGGLVVIFAGFVMATRYR